METTNFFNHYGRVQHQIEEAAFRTRRRQRTIILSLSILLLLILLVTVLAGSIVRHRSNSNPGGDSTMIEAVTAAVTTICNCTRFPKLCFFTLIRSNSTKKEIIFRYSLTAAMESLLKVAKFPDEYKNRTDDPNVGAALTVCTVVLEDAVTSLDDCISAANGDIVSEVVHDLRTWLSSAVTYQATCFDAIDEANANATFVEEIRSLMRNSTELVSNSLAIVTKVFEKLANPTRRRLLGFPAWIGDGERRMLQWIRPMPNVTVAKDGTGDVKTIAEAVKRIPKKSETRFVIHIKTGVYEEYVALNNSITNVMIYGDGMHSTIISGNRTKRTENNTFFTSTFSVTGRGFIARDIGFRNTAGREGLQAVAFRSGSDKSVLYRCSFDAFQDTLYAHTNDQFYRECFINGTVDFIFGNANAVFQNCTISPKQPLPNQFVTITAQGKTEPDQNSGTSIQMCTLTASSDFNATAYFGRPWRSYSTVVVMKSDIGNFLNPEGWSPWQNQEPPKSIFYGEYKNTGAGSGTSGRVKWPGYRATMTAEDADKFGVEKFIQGTSWLPKTGVPFYSTL